MSWATNYINPNNLNIPYQGIISDGKLFTDYSPSAVINDKIKEMNNIKTNADYKNFLTKNATSIIDYIFRMLGFE